MSSTYCDNYHQGLGQPVVVVDLNRSKHSKYIPQVPAFPSSPQAQVRLQGLLVEPLY